MLDNPKKTKDEIVQWIRDYFEKAGPHCRAVVGISGGKDSSVVAALCKEALGSERVVGVLMPQGIQPDIDDSYRVVKELGIRHKVVNIVEAYAGMTGALAFGEVELTEQARVNLPARLRMTTLYAVAQSFSGRGGARVANTCNYSEDYVGYATKFGDGAGDFSPLGKLLVEEVKQIGYELGLPRELVDKTPSDGLCGKTDEENLGFTYNDLDRYIKTGTSGVSQIDEMIAALHARNLHKLEPMPTYTGVRA